jgi:Secretion system C-terminal sorting domain/Putative carbohydrate metabolism domain
MQFSLRLRQANRALFSVYNIIIHSFFNFKTIFIMKNQMQSVLSTLLLILLCATQHFGQIQNSSFENWTPLSPLDSTNMNAKYALNNWKHCDNFLQETDSTNFAFFGTFRDSTARSGNYALTLSRWYSIIFDAIKYSDAIQSRPNSFKGYYKYLPGELREGSFSPTFDDEAFVLVYLTKSNTITNQKDTIGRGKLDLIGANNYTLFEVPINYTNSMLTPDSITIVIAPTKYGGRGFCWGNCSWLTIDDVELSNDIVSVEQTTPNSAIKVYPNPTAHSFNIDFETGIELPLNFQITTILGQNLLNKSLSLPSNPIDLSKLTNGIYIYTLLNTDNKIVKQGKIVKN